jgi:hypothetical protein
VKKGFRWYCVGAGSFIVGMAYGSWACQQDGPIPIWATLFLGSLGVAIVLSVTPLLWRVDA